MFHSENKKALISKEISGVKRQAQACPCATGNRSPLQHTMARLAQIASRGNTDLLTCVREQNCSCAHILPSHRSSLQWRTFVPAVSRFGVASRAQHRFVSAFLPASWPVPHKMCHGTGMYYGTNHIKFYGRKGPRLSSLYRFIIHVPPCFASGSSPAGKKFVIFTKTRPHNWNS